MSFINSDGLSLLVGDGAGTENFVALKGAEISRFQISQQLVDSNAVSADAWSIGGATAGRRAVVECTALATDEAQATRVRSLAMSGLAGNFRVNATAASSFQFAAYVTNYLEIIQAGGIKKIQLRLESSAAVTVG